MSMGKTLFIPGSPQGLAFNSSQTGIGSYLLRDAFLEKRRSKRCTFNLTTWIRTIMKGIAKIQVIIQVGKNLTIPGLFFA